MRRIPKLFSITLALVLVALLVLKILLPLGLSSQFARRHLEKALSHAMERPVEFIPKLRMSWGMIPHLTIGDLAISNPTGFSESPKLLLLESIATSFDTWKLLTGGVVFPILTFEHGNVNLVTDAAGKNNWSISGNPELVAQKEDPDSSLWLPQIDLIALDDVKFSYLDRRTDASYQGRVTSLSVKHVGSGNPLELAAKAAFDGQELSLNAKVGTLTKLLAGNEWPVDLHLQFAGQDLKVDGTARLEDSGDVSGAVNAQLTGTELGKFLESFEIRPVPAISTYDVSGNFSIRNGLLKFSLDNSSIESIALKASGQARFDGERPAGDVNLEVSGSDLQSALKNLGISSAPPLKAFRVVAAATADAEAVKLTVRESSFDALKLDGTVTQSIADSEITGTFTLHNVDLKQLLSTADGDSDQPKEKKSDKFLFSEQPLDLSILQRPKISLDFRVDNLTLPNDLQISDVAASVVVQKGELEVPRLVAHAQKGELSAKMLLGQSGLNLELHGTNLPFDKISPSEGVKGGTADLDVTLKGTGNSARNIVATLNGGIELRLRDIDLTKGGLFVSTSNLFDILNPLAKDSAAVTLTCSLFKFNVTNGIARSSGLATKIGDVSILGDGQIDLQKETLSLGFVPRSSSVGASTLVPPLKVYGSIFSPTIVPNPLGLATAQLDTIQSIFTGSLPALGDFATGLGRMAGISKYEVGGKARGPDEICQQILDENAGKLTTLVGGLVFGTVPLPADTQDGDTTALD